MSTEAIENNISGERVFELRCKKQLLFPATMVDALLDPQSDILARTLGQRKTLLVTTPTVSRLYGEQMQAYVQDYRLDVSTLILQCGENRKSLREVTQVLNECRSIGMGRRSVILAFGGGVCSDIASLSASLLRRGVSYVRIPTTLIGLVDAGVGIKGGVNFSGKKSYIGCFYPPEGVLLDTRFLHSLPRPYLEFGMAEIIKMALVKDAELFGLVESHYARLLSSAFSDPTDAGRRIIQLAVVRMMEQLQENPYEDQTYKRLVDFGHTFSPLIEAATDFTVHHGQAVAVDMALTITLGVELGVTDPEVRDRYVCLANHCNLPFYSQLLTMDMCEQALDEACLHRDGAVNLVTPIEVGKATFLEARTGVPRQALQRSLDWLAKRAAAATSEELLVA